MADCIAAEVARSRAEPLATSDPDLLDLCHVEDVARTVLPRSEARCGHPRLQRPESPASHTATDDPERHRHLGAEVRLVEEAAGRYERFEGQLELSNDLACDRGSPLDQPALP